MSELGRQSSPDCTHQCSRENYVSIPKLDQHLQGASISWLQLTHRVTGLEFRNSAFHPIHLFVICVEHTADLKP